MERVTWDYDDIYNINLSTYKIKKSKKYSEIHLNNIFCFDIETSNGFRLDNGKVIAFSHKRYDDFIKKSQRLALQGIKSDDKPAEFKNPVSLMYVWQCAVETDDNIITFMGRTWGDFETFIEKLNDSILNFQIFGSNSKIENIEDCDYKNFVAKNYTNKVEVHMYVHNLSFEFQHLRNTKFRMKQVFAREMRKPMKAIFELSNIRVTLHDTLSLVQKSLRNWAKDSKLPVQKEVAINYLRIMTPETPLSDKVLKYCVADVVTMVYGMKQYRSKYNNRLSEIPMTQTGEVRQICRKKISSVNRDWAESCYYIDHTYSFEYYRKLVSAFAGGWTHANQKYADKLMHNVICYDFASSYPSVMTSARFPVSSAVEIDEKRIDEIDKLDIEDRDSCYLLTVDIYNFISKTWNTFWSSSKIDVDEDGNILSDALVLDNGKIISGDYARITMTDLDWKTFREVYDIERYSVVSAYEMKTDYLPQEMIFTILDYFENKSKLKGSGNDSLYNESKQFINSIYGCCVMKLVTDEISFKGDWVKHIIADESEFMELSGLPDSAEKIERGISQWFTTYQIGVWVTAWARYRLWQMIKILDDKVVYCDTDSIKGLFDDNDISLFDDYNNHISDLQQKVADYYNFDVNRYKALTAKGKIKQLGIFEREDDCEDFKTLGAKRYVAKHGNDVEATIAGLPKSAASAHIKEVDDLCNNIYWTPAESGKLMAHYVDDMPHTIWTDKQGNKYESDDKYGIMLEPVGFDLSLAAEYEELLNFLSGNSEYYNITKVLR